MPEGVGVAGAQTAAGIARPRPGYVYKVLVESARQVEGRRHRGRLVDQDKVAVMSCCGACP